MKENTEKISLEVKPLGLVGRVADFLMLPIMYLISGTFKETPQGGHRWNVKLFQQKEVESLDQKMMIHCQGVSKAMRRRWLFLYHLPIFGGWKYYILIEPVDHKGTWFIGFVARDVTGVSRIKLSRPVRMLVGKDDVSFFALDASSCEQIAIKKIGQGRIGDGGPFAKEKLL